MFYMENLIPLLHIIIHNSLKKAEFLQVASSEDPVPGGFSAFFIIHCCDLTLSKLLIIKSCVLGHFLLCYYIYGYQGIIQLLQGVM